MRIYLLPLLMAVGFTATAAEVQVFKSDQSVQCEPDSGIPSEGMAAELKGAGVEVYSISSGHDGLMRASMCGMPTGNIHIFAIDEAGLKTAIELGFAPVENHP